MKTTTFQANAEQTGTQVCPDAADNAENALQSPFLLIPETVSATDPQGDPGAASQSAWLVDPTRHLVLPASSDQYQLPARQPDDQGVEYPVEPRLMKLLCLLAANASQVVDRELLIDALWPRVVVNDNSLNRAVSDLRKALHTDGHAWIQTVPKRGYRLAASVRSLAPSPGLSAQPTPTTEPRPGWQRWIPSAAAAVLLAFSVLTQLGSQPGSEVASQAPLVALPEDRVLPATPLLQTPDSATIVNSHYLRSPTRDSVLSDSALVAHDLERDFPLLESDRPAVKDTPAPAIVVTERQLMAYVDKHDGISQLKLRHAFADDTPWVAFTTDENIRHLQWSPLDDGLLFTVGKESRESGATYMRLMLLDMDTLSLHELYRREVSPELEGTSGKLT